MTDIISSLNTTIKSTWCPGCYNFQVLAAFKNLITEQIKAGKKKEDFAIVTGIGCHAKIFDYVNLNGINTLHGRVLPTCIGMKIARPELTIFGFAGDGDAYAEGISHLIHAARYDKDINYIVHNNQVFALTVGQPTPTTEKGFIDKTTPKGVQFQPLNPIKLMLAVNCGFVARVFADIKQIENIMKEAVKHNGFSFIEVIQPCLIFHPDLKFKEHTYNLQEKGHNKHNWKEAMEKACEFDYNKINEKTKIPLGIFYQEIRMENFYPISFSKKPII